MRTVSITVETWARNYLESHELSTKIDPPPLPHCWEDSPASVDLRPGRPSCLSVTRSQPNETKLRELKTVEGRARLIHKFWHHELQAAELMAWALLRFPQTPQAFRRGLLGVLHDEVRHMGMYQQYLQRTGFQIGSFPVRDAFWDRVPLCQTPIAFVAVMGMGLEAANLEHTQRFAERFRAVGDTVGAELHEQVGREEVAHVRFATRWFREWTSDVQFDAWQRALPEAVKVGHLRGKQLHWEARRRAEMPEAFLKELERTRG